MRRVERRAASRARALVGDVVDLLVPTVCLGCGGRLPVERRADLVCARCVLSLRPPPPPLCARCGLPTGTGSASGATCEECAGWPTILARARAAAVLEPPADRLVHGLKYGGWAGLARVMVEGMARAVERVGPGRREDLIVPVPTTRTRRRRRGYNQAAVLAEALARSWDRPVTAALCRRGGSRTQVSLQPSERAHNVRRAFAVLPGGRGLRGRSVLLVDDVLTTGATAAAAARALEGAGVERVTLVTFARALPYR